MKLPDDGIGITDIIAFRECPRRMSYGMRRHTGVGEQDESRTPEKDTAGPVWASAYGSAVHDAIAAVEDGHGDDEAIQVAWGRSGDRLNPGDIDLLRGDLDMYRARDFPGMRTVASEDEYRVPLLRRNGQQIYFRFKVDRLYENLTAPGTYIHIDWKSSRHAKSEKEVHDDLQLWAYNWAIHEYFPEVQTLVQVYDQLRYGQINTRKSAAQRVQMRDWLVKQVTAILDDDEVKDDGLHAPRHNRWCAWCPIMESCPVIDDLTEFALVQIAALAPAEKVGRKTVLDLASERVPDYAHALPDVKRALVVLKRFEESVRDLIKDMAPEQRIELGFDVRGRRETRWSAQALKALHDQMGDDFYDLVKLTKTGLESHLGDRPDLLELALSLGDHISGAESVIALRG